MSHHARKRRWLLGLLLVLSPSLVLAETQQSVLTWDAYIPPVLEGFVWGPAMGEAMGVVTPSQALSQYEIRRGIGEICNQVSAPLPEEHTIIVPRTPLQSPAYASPMTYTDTTYPDQNGLVCWEIYLRFKDGSLSPRSTRLVKEIISTKASPDARVE